MRCKSISPPSIRLLSAGILLLGGAFLLLYFFMRKKPTALGRRLQFLPTPKYPVLPHLPEKEQVSVIRTNCHPGI